MGLALVRLDVQTAMEEEAQRVLVVAVEVGQVGVGEGALEQFLRDDALLFEDPREHHAHQVAQDGLPLPQVLPRLHPPRPLRDVLVELLAERSGLQRSQQAVGGERAIPGAEKEQEFGDGGAGGRGGQRRIERRGHIDLPACGDGEARFDAAVRRGAAGQHDRRAGFVDACECSGADRRVPPGKSVDGVVAEVHRRDDDALAGQTGAGGAQRGPGGVGVGFPIGVVGVFANAQQRHVLRQVGLDEGGGVVQHRANEVFGEPVPGDVREQRVGGVGRLRGRRRLEPRLDALPSEQGVEAGQQFADFLRLEGGLALLGDGAEVALDDEFEVGVGRVARPAVDAPLDAVGQDP